MRLFCLILLSFQPRFRWIEIRITGQLCPVAASGGLQLQVQFVKQFTLFPTVYILMPKICGEKSIDS